MQRLLVKLAALCVVLAIAMGTAYASPATLVADSQISRIFIGKNFGGATDLFVGSGNVAFIQFDLSTLPAGTQSSQVAKATLTFYVSKINTAGALELRPVTGAWNEYSLTYLNAPLRGAAIGTSGYVSKPGTFVSVDMTSLLKSWIDSPASNHGVAILPAASTPLAFVAVDSKENNVTSHPASLDVTLSGPQGVAGPQGLPGVAGPMGPQGPAGTSFISPPQAQVATGTTDFWSMANNPFTLDNNSWTSHKGKLELGDIVGNMSIDVNAYNWGRTVIGNDSSDPAYNNTALNVTSYTNKPGDAYGQYIEVAADPSNQTAVGGVTGLYVEMDTPTPDRLVNPAKMVQMSAMQIWSETGAPIQRLHGIDIQKLGVTNGDEVVGLDVESLYNSSNPANLWAIRTQQGKVEFGDKLIVHGNVDAASITVNGQPFVGAVGPMGPQGLTGPQGPQGPQGPAGPSGGPAGPQGASLLSFGADLNSLAPSDQFFNIMTGARNQGSETSNNMAMVANACTIDTLIVKTDSAPGAASETFTVRTGSTPTLSATALSCTIAGSSQTCSSNATASLNAGDLIGLQLSVTGASLPSSHHVWVALTCK
jgi:hypothetical protein